MRRIKPALWTLLALAMAVIGCKPPPPTTPAAIASEPNRLYWGDTHVHSTYSSDAYAMGNHTADPDTAYRWAKGLPVVHPRTKAKVRIEKPLDFMMLTDHSEDLGSHLDLVTNRDDLHLVADILAQIGLIKPPLEPLIMAAS